VAVKTACNWHASEQIVGPSQWPGAAELGACRSGRRRGDLRRGRRRGRCGRRRGRGGRRGGGGGRRGGRGGRRRGRGGRRRPGEPVRQLRGLRRLRRLRRVVPPAARPLRRRGVPGRRRSAGRRAACGGGAPGLALARARVGAHRNHAARQVLHDRPVRLAVRRRVALVAWPCPAAGRSRLVQRSTERAAGSSRSPRSAPRQPGRSGVCALLCAKRYKRAGEDPSSTRTARATRAAPIALCRPPGHQAAAEGWQWASAWRTLGGSIARGKERDEHRAEPARAAPPSHCHGGPARRSGAHTDPF